MYKRQELVFSTTFRGPWVSKCVFSEIADLHKTSEIMMFRDVLHFCFKISFRSIFDAKWVPSRLKMEAYFETFCDF